MKIVPAFEARPLLRVILNIDRCLQMLFMCMRFKGIQAIILIKKMFPNIRPKL